MSESRPPKLPSGKSDPKPPKSVRATANQTVDSTASGSGLLRNAKLPKTLGRYDLLKRVGRGAMGTVFLAHDTLLDREVAFKVPQFSDEDDPTVLKRFYQEARAAATLHHANICPVHDVGEIEGVHYLTMAYLEGRQLSDVVGSGRAMNPRAAANLTRTLALALAEAHRKGIIHRDLKPANVMILDRIKPVIMDFGLARQMGTAPDSRLTQAGAIVGTPGYMPPEQVKSELDLMGPACDIYSLGVMLYEMLSGQLPFDDTPAMVMALILTQEPQPPSAHRPNLDADIEAICMKAMAKTIEDRFPSMEEFAEALANYLRTTAAQTQISQPSADILDAVSVAAGKPASPPPIPAAGGSSTVESPAESAKERPKLGYFRSALVLAAGIVLGSAAVHLTMKPVIEELPKSITNGIGLQLNLIPAGEFLMGTDAPKTPVAEVSGGEEDESPRHFVKISRPFYMGIHEVTQRQYEAIMDENPSQLTGADLPVESVTWEDANEFCRRLSLRERKLYRLPTEAEWEYACRAGTNTAWHFGDDPAELKNYGWFGENTEGTTHPVGRKNPNPLELFDMHGNVPERCIDQYDHTYYEKSPSADPLGPTSSENGFNRVVRGGHWGDLNARHTRSSWRYPGTQSNESKNGFRVLREAD